MKYSEAITDSDCAIAQALAVLGDWWTLLILREVAGGRMKFNQLADELGLSARSSRSAYMISSSMGSSSDDSTQNGRRGSSISSPIMVAACCRCSSPCRTGVLGSFLGTAH